MRQNIDEEERDRSRSVVTKMEIKCETDVIEGDGGERHGRRGDRGSLER